MNTVLTARLQHMADSELLAMIPRDTLARIKSSDPNPEFRAYVIAHEGAAEGNMVGIGHRVMQYFRDAIIKLHDKLAMGTQIFHRHGATNDHAGRDPVGELAGKALRVIDGKLHDIAAIYVKPEHRHKPLDIASIEADVVFTDDGGGKCTAVDIGDITGIALSSSAVERPGFAGATLLATIQAFVGGEEKTMTIEELKAEAKKLNAKPSDVFEADVLHADPIVHDKIEKTGREAARRVKDGELADLKKELQEANVRADAVQKERDAAKVEVLRGKTSSMLESLSGERKLTDAQKAFVKRGFEKFKTESSDENGVKADLQKHLDSELKEFSDLAKMLGVETASESKHAPSSDGSDNAQGNSDIADNPFILPEYKK